MKVAIVSGASGLVGMSLLHQLFQNPEYDYVISVGRIELAIKHAKLVQLAGDLGTIEKWNWADMMVANDLGGVFQDLRSAIENGDCQIHSFCSIGTTIKKAGSQEEFFRIDHDLVIGIARWVKNLGATRFLYVSALGADSQSSVFYNKVKGQVEAGLKELDFELLGLFRPSLLLGDRKEFRFGEMVATVFMKPLVWLKLLKNFRPIFDFQVAKSMVLIALKNEGLGRVEIISSGQMQDLTV